MIANDSQSINGDNRHESKILSAAIQYAENGYPVFPCVPNRKIGFASDHSCNAPPHNHGSIDATTDTETIEAWWSEHPTANIGVSTRGLCVVDIDGADHPWLANADIMSELSVNAVTVTPRGGLHCWFTQRDGVPIGSRSDAFKKADDPPLRVTNVDIRADGGHVVAPPSYVIDEKKGIDGAYQFKPTLELPHRSELSAVPSWIASQATGSKKSTPQQEVATLLTPSANVDLNHTAEAIRLIEHIPDDFAHNRDDWLRVGMALHSICAALLFVWIAFSKRSSKYEPGECERLWRGFDANREGGVGIGTLRHYSQPASIEPRLSLISSADFAVASYPKNYIVNGVLCEGQNCVMGGKSKTLKTATAIDLVTSIGSGTPFLGQFDVKQKRRVMMLSGESGESTTQETARRICANKGIELGSVDAFWGFQLPRVSAADDMLEFRNVVNDNDIEVAVVDPLYLCLLDDSNANQASNMLGMGPQLSKITDAVRGTGCTVVCLHHARKGSNNSYDPMDLEDLAMAGIAEWARQWLLLSRRDAYEQGSGEHRLWLNVGGSAGHNSLWGVNINEGHPDLYGGRYWNVEIEAGGDLLKDKRREAENRKQAKQDEAVRGRQAKVIETLRKYPGGLSKSQVSAKSGVNSTHTAHVLELSIDEELVEECEIMVSNRKKPISGYRINHSTQTSQTTQTDSNLVGLF
jgi:hypothetical protein